MPDRYVSTCHVGVVLIIFYEQSHVWRHGGTLRKFVCVMGDYDNHNHNILNNEQHVVDMRTAHKKETHLLINFRGYWEIYRNVH